MLSICKSCNNLRCGNHAACARNKALEAQQQGSRTVRLGDVANLNSVLDADFAIMWIVIGVTETSVQHFVAAQPEAGILMERMPLLAEQFRINIAEEVVRNAERELMERQLRRVFGF